MRTWPEADVPLQGIVFLQEDWQVNWLLLNHRRFSYYLARWADNAVMDAYPWP